MIRAWFVRGFDNPVNGVVDGLVIGFLDYGAALKSAVFESFPTKPQFHISALTDHNLNPLAFDVMTAPKACDLTPLSFVLQGQVHISPACVLLG